MNQQDLFPAEQLPKPEGLPPEISRQFDSIIKQIMSGDYDEAELKKELALMMEAI